MAQVASRLRRRWLLIAVLAVVAVLVIFGILSGFYINILWFREVHQSDVFWTIFWTKLKLGVVFGVLFFILLLANLLVVRRLRPQFRVYTPEQEIVERYRAALEPYAKVAVPLFCAVIAVFVGVAVSGQWQTFLLWKSVGPVHFPGQVDPLFHRNPAFYIFILPFWQFVQGWLFATFVGITVIVTIAHYLTGGIRLQSAGEKVSPQVKAHLSVLLGIILLIKAWGYYLGRFDLLTSSHGVVTGASYTDIHAELPALNLLMFIAVFCGLLFFVNIRLRGWAIPVIAIGLLGVVSIVVGGLVPAAVQRFSVQPQQYQKEQRYIADNIRATRYAFELSTINEQTTSPAGDISADEVAENGPTVSNIRLWNPTVLQRTYLSLQRIQPYYEFSDVDVDRYPVISGSGVTTSGSTGVAERLTMISAREVSQAEIPAGSQTWQNTHLVYTHGFAAVASLGNSVTAGGSPSFLSENVPAQVHDGFPALGPKGSQIYFGEIRDVPYVVVDTKQPELNYQSPNTQAQVTTHYQGKGGIVIGSFFRRLAFAYHYRDFNLLISGLIDSDSKILINRDIRSRVSKIAPFLKYDGDPYATVVDGRLVFVQDAYTTTSAYPYSQELPLAAATNGVLKGTANYIRNSVKVTVDAYDGTVRFWVADPSDPLIQVWMRAFPDLFTTKAPPADIEAHFRYPENLLQVQATQFATYHVTNTQTFYSKSRQWQLPNALPVHPKPGAFEREYAATHTLRPYYVVMKLPNDPSGAEEFYLFEPFTPLNRQNMTAYIAAASDGYGQSGSGYGRLTVYEFPTGLNVNGPQQVRNFINQDPTVSAEVSLLSQQGSQVVFGDLLVVPVNDGFLYVQPIFVESSQGGTVIPELKKVAVVHGSTVSMGNTLSEALALSFAGQTTPSGPTPPGGATVQDLLTQALKDFAAAQVALHKGDLATYQKEIQSAQALVNQANKLAAKGGSGSTGHSSGGSTGGTKTPTPTPSASATATPSG